MTYQCQVCGYREEVGGRTDDGPIIIHSRVLGVTAMFENSAVKAVAEAEIRHVTSRRCARNDFGEMSQEGGNSNAGN
jgi:hypothetical protein